MNWERIFYITDLYNWTNYTKVYQFQDLTIHYSNIFFLYRKRGSDSKKWSKNMR